MKSFDLELAKAGHPLITRDGQKVNFFHYDNKRIKGSYKCYASIEEGFITALSTGRNIISFESNLDLFLDDSIPWEKPLVEGNIIQVYYSSADVWKNEIYLHEDKNGNLLSVFIEDDYKYENGMDYEVNFIKKGFWRRKPEAVKVKVNDPLPILGLQDLTRLAEAIESNTTVEFFKELRAKNHQTQRG